MQDHGQLSSLHAAGVSWVSYVTSTLAIFYQLEKLFQNTNQLALYSYISQVTLGYKAVVPSHDVTDFQLKNAQSGDLVNSDETAGGLD